MRGELPNPVEGCSVIPFLSSDFFSMSIGPGWVFLILVLVLVFRGRKMFNSIYTLRGYAPTAKLSRLAAKLVGARDLSREEFFRADNPPEQVVGARRAGLQKLAARLNSRGVNTSNWAGRMKSSMSDLRFADANRVPFPFAKVMREAVDLCSVSQRSEGPYLVDMDDDRALDVSGSYGVNVAGYDRYKAWLAAGMRKVQDLGPVLGPLHPVVAENIEYLQQISGQEEVSFHTSGTEAVMAAVRLARFNTRRKKIVCFSGAYHGWWDGVQPGLGSERAIGDCLTLSEMKRGSLQVIRARRKEIAGVLINPVQSFHPNSPPPNDAVLLTSDVRQMNSERPDPQHSEYARWLRDLRKVCTECDIPLIFDEVYSGFRLAPGGAQAYYGIQADLVLYGKTLAAGLPIGVVCGSSDLMRRFDPKHPMRIAYVVGTFSAYPMAMGAMNEFLKWVVTPEAEAEYMRANAMCGNWIADANTRFGQLELPIQLHNLGTIWTIEFTQAGRFAWLLQYYLRAEGVNLSWVGTGRCLASFDFTEQDYANLTLMMERAVKQMITDKWWLSDQEQPMRDKQIRAGAVKDLVKSLVPQGLQAFYQEVMQRKHDDHEASHSDRVNQFLHLLSSSAFIYCYWLIFSDLVTAMWLGLGALFIRQIGHALIEPPCHDAEQLLLGFDTRSKSVIVAIYLLIPAVNCIAAPELTWPLLINSVAASVAVQWFWFTALVILGRVVLLIRRHGFKNAMVWFVKLITDPVTDIKAYYGSAGVLIGRGGVPAVKE